MTQPSKRTTEHGHKYSVLRRIAARVPDLLFAGYVFFLVSGCVRASRLARKANVESIYSYVVISIALLGLVLLYLSFRYGRSRVVRKRVSQSWRIFWTLIFFAIAGELILRPNLSPFASAPHWTAQMVFWGVVALLIASSAVALVSMLRTGSTAPRLFAFLLVAALMIFVFAQPYIYGGLVGSGWDTEALAESAERIVEQGGTKVTSYALSATDAELHGLVQYLTDSGIALERLDTFMPARILFDGLCERRSFGAALYFSVITFTSVGYGDLVPVPALRGQAAGEAIVGYLFMAAFAALLIRWMRVPSREKGD